MLSFEDEDDRRRFIDDVLDLIADCGGNRYVWTQGGSDYTALPFSEVNRRMREEKGWTMMHKVRPEDYNVLGFDVHEDMRFSCIWSLGYGIGGRGATVIGVGGPEPGKTGAVG